MSESTKKAVKVLKRNFKRSFKRKVYNFLCKLYAIYEGFEPIAKVIWVVGMVALVISAFLCAGTSDYAAEAGIHGWEGAMSDKELDHWLLYILIGGVFEVLLGLAYHWFGITEYEE